MTAQVAASELESNLAAFRIDASWTKTYLAFLIAWTTKPWILIASPKNLSPSLGGLTPIEEATGVKVIFLHFSSSIEVVTYPVRS